MFDHAFPSRASGKAAPYGIYDLKAHAGWVGLGLSSDTPAFAVDGIEAGRVAEGRARYPGATRLLVLADSGGSNGISPRAWKHRVQHTLCNRHRLTVTLAHYPSGIRRLSSLVHSCVAFPVSTH